MALVGERIPDARRIAVLRANAIGDFVFALPALEALRAAYPEAEIVLLGLPWHAAFLKDRPGPVDRVVVIPPCRGIGQPESFVNDEAALDGFFARMADERFDLALQLHGGGKNSTPFVQRLGARVTAGLRAENAPPLDRWMPYIYFQHEIMRFLEAVALVGAAPVTTQPNVPVTYDDLAEACRVVPDDGHPLAVLHPGATDSRRRWPAEKFAAVGDALAGEGAQVLVTGAGEDEEAVVEAVIAAMWQPAENLWNQLSLGGLAGLLARSRVVVSNDSGPVHLAEAVGAATVGIYWCFNLLNADPMTRTLHRPLLAWRLDCPRCGRNCLTDNCEHRDSFVADVPVTDVTQHALDLLHR